LGIATGDSHSSAREQLRERSHAGARDSHEMDRAFVRAIDQ
jgi:hypothetical protein